MDARPVSVWANPKPIFPIIPADSIIPTGAGLGSTWEAGTTPSPFALGPVPALQSHIPNPRYRFRKVETQTEPSTSKPTTSKPSTSKPSSSKTTTTTTAATTRTRSRSRPESSRPGPSRSAPAPARTAPVTTLTLTPVTVQGVPGSTVVGIDTVSDVQQLISGSKLIYIFIQIIFILDFGFTC